MDIIVLMKRTFDTGEKVVITDNKISEDGVEYIINPYDEYALEEAIQLREEYGGNVTLISVGPPETEKELRTGLAMGADQAILVEHDLSEADERTISKLLAAVISQRSFDLILGGNVTGDNGAGQVALRVAQLVDIPHVATIVDIKLEGNQAVLERDVEGDIEVIETTLPALFTAQQGLNEPRYPSLKGIMGAKRKPLQQTNAEQLGLADEIAPKTELVEVSLPPQKSAGKILTGEQPEQVKELIQLLKQESKVLSGGIEDG